MNCFELLKRMLDKEYAAIDGTEKKKDAAVCKQLDDFITQYRDLRTYRNIDYSSPTTRFAYVFKYVTAHANLVYDRILASNPLRTLFATDGRVRVTCLGGGPGSDLLGIIKYLDVHPTGVRLRVSVFDRESAWGDTWDAIFEETSFDHTLARQFIPFDVLDAAEWSKQNKYLESDLFTMVYFMSEVYGLRDTADAFFHHVMSKAKSGALFLFVDNMKSGSTRRFSDWFDRLANENGLTIIESDEGRQTPSPAEEKNALNPYVDKFGSPKIASYVAWRIARKP